MARSWVEIRGNMVTRNPENPRKKSVKAGGAGLSFSDYRFPQPDPKRSGKTWFFSGVF